MITLHVRYNDMHESAATYTEGKRLAEDVHLALIRKAQGRVKDIRIEDTLSEVNALRGIAAAQKMIFSRYVSR